MPAIANVFTGRAGRETCERTAAETAKLVGCKPKEVFIASTGVIGEPLPTEKLLAALPAASASWRPIPGPRCRAAIMTTDTFPKGATRTAKIGEATVTISGIAKGSGMIAPDMATMLSFIATDAKIPAAALQKLLSKGTDEELQLRHGGQRHLHLRHGAALRHRPGEASARAGRGRPDAEGFFARRWTRCCTSWRCMVARDGEGAQKLVTIDVTGAVSAKSAQRSPWPSPIRRW
jgi:glutamate N-acetyltransferase/amino-acid N-acetyltransferase